MTRAAERSRPGGWSLAADGLRSFLRRSPVIWLLPLLGLFLTASIAFNPGGAPTGDEGPLLGAAHRLLQGTYAASGTTNPVQFLWHGPGLPAFLAPLLALGLSLGEMRLTSPLLMFAAVVLFYHFLRLRLSRRAALIGAYALGLYAPGYYVLGTVAKEPLALLLSIGALYGIARYVNGGRRRHAALGALSLAGLVMTRVEYGWVTAIILLGGVVWWLFMAARHSPASERTRVARRWVAVYALAMLACVPWLAYTYALTGHLFYWGNSGGLSLFWMSSPSSSQLGQWHSPTTVFLNPALAAYRPLFSHLTTLSPLRSDLELQHLAVVHALAHPAKYALNLLANLGRTFFGFPFSFTLPAGAIAALVLINGALLVALIVSGVVVLRRRTPLPPEGTPFLLFGIVGLGVHLLPTSEPRMVIPLMPVPIWLIGQALGGRVLALGKAEDSVRRVMLASPAVRWKRPVGALRASARAVRAPGWLRDPVLRRLGGGARAARRLPAQAQAARERAR